MATVEGDLHEVDVLILATGFKVMDVDSLTYAITGRERPDDEPVLEGEPDAGL